MKLSIITINLNNAEGLARTIESVVKQSFREFEYIIIDGCSTDDSVKIIKKYADKIDYWISEKDSGIYNAMNKGIANANGEYLLMLNSGDRLVNEGILETVFKDNLKNSEIMYGNVQWESQGKLCEIRTFPGHLTFQFFWKKSLGHQSTFIKRNVHDRVGLYDEKLQFSADWKFFILALCKYDISFQYLPTIISICDMNGFSWNPKFAPIRKTEHEAVLNEYFTPFISDYKELDQFKNGTSMNWFKNLTEILKSPIKKIYTRSFTVLFNRGT